MGWESIPGWFSFGHAYDQMVECANDGDSIVEIGVAFGRSVAYLARRVIDSGKDIKIYAVDPWEPGWKVPKPGSKPGWGGEHEKTVIELGGPFNAFLSMMITYAPEELERIHVMRCSGTVARIGLGAPSIAGVLIDGDHSYDAVKWDIAMWESMVKPGGVLAGDDYCDREFPGVVRAVKERFGKDYQVRGTTWMRRM